MSFRRAHLDYFVAVAEEGQITRAAARLHVAQPALSQAMAQLEGELGVALLERHARGVTLTAAGAAFLPKAQAAVAANEDAALTAEWLARAAENTIEFGFLGHAPALDSPALLAALKDTHPEIEVRFRELPFPSPPTKRWLASVDLAVSHRPPEDPDIWAHPLREEPRVVLASKTHPLAGRREVTVDEAAEQAFIGMHPSVDPGWSGFWSLNDQRGGPPHEITGDRALNAHEVLGALIVREAITTAPASVAAMILNDLTGIVAIPLRGAPPAVITLTGHANRQNPVVTEVLAFALQVDVGSPVRAQT